MSQYSERPSIKPVSPVSIFRYLRTRFAADSVAGRIGRGSFWGVAGTGVTQLSLLLTSMLVARILGDAAFGEFGMVRSTILTFGILAGSGINLATMKYVAELRENDPERAGRILGLLVMFTTILGAISTAVCVSIAPVISGRLLHSPELAAAICAGAFLLSLQPMNSLLSGSLLGLEAFGISAGIALIEALFLFVLISMGAWFCGVTGATGGIVAASSICLVARCMVLRALCARANIHVSLRGSLSEINVLWSFVLPAVLVGLSIQPFEWFARITLSRGVNGFAEVGYFTAAFGLSQIIVLLPDQITTPSVALLTNLLSVNRLRSFKKLLILNVLGSFCVGVIVALIVIMLSPLMMQAYGSSFVAAQPVLVVMAISAAVGTVSSALRGFFSAVTRLWIQVAYSLIWGVCLMFSGLVLIKRMGALGLALAYLIAYLVTVLIQAVLAIMMLKKETARRESEQAAVLDG